ncbi:hypothetical protein B0J12DRAFT_123733 [Macrophomina phaseolina]|uniref:Uncharacterized protein n=1 Tax=Macrophomina phaseolina TaxID=35725 RepID=A0ABQ8G7V4_9PEZI|nr:hypothetical protein B0J12DRAFT_123733 [Macrophomina phaseolina]
MDLFLSAVTTVSSFLGAASNHTQHAVTSIQWTQLPGDAQRFFARVAGAGTNFIEMRWDDLPDKTKEWIKAHPYQTAFYVAHGIVIVAPTPVTAPLIGAAGLATASPAAGSAVAAIQHALTTVGTGGVALRTAVTTGHGAPAIADGLQAAFAIGTGIYGLWAYFAGAAAKEEPPKAAPAAEESTGKRNPSKRSKTAQVPAEPRRSALRNLFSLRRRKTMA